MPTDRERPESPGRPATPRGEQRKLLRTGTYLHTYCPLCGADLNYGSWVRLDIVGPHERRGVLKLSPRFNIFDKQSTLALREGTRIKDLCCPRCHASLLVAGRTCQRCQSPAARLRVSAVDAEVELHFCTRVGCPWHGLAEADRRRLDLEERG